jgi:hypothetical protein
MTMLLKSHGCTQDIVSFFMIRSSGMKTSVLKKRKRQKSNDLRRVPIRRGMASSWNVRRRPILSANDPPVNEPTVAPANVELTTHPEACQIETFVISTAKKIRQSSKHFSFPPAKPQLKDSTKTVCSRSENPFKTADSSVQTLTLQWGKFCLWCQKIYLEGQDLLQIQGLLQCTQVLHSPLCIVSFQLKLVNHQKVGSTIQSYGSE